MADYPGSIATWSDKTDGIDWPEAVDVNQANNEVIAVETELGTDVAGSATNLKSRLIQSMDNSGNIDFATSTELTIASGSITPTQNWHTVDTEADAASDDLDTIVASGVSDGFVLFFRANNTARTVVVKHNTGNIVCFGAADISLDETYKSVRLIYDATLTKWVASAPPDVSSYITASSTTTLTNKRITKRIVTVTMTATPAINVDNGDVFQITGLNTAITSLTANLTGTPTDGQMMLMEITDNGTSRAITPGASFLGTANNPISALATTISKCEMLLWKYSAALTKWELVGRDHSA
jgi:hypothetical protein